MSKFDATSQNNDSGRALHRKRRVSRSGVAPTVRKPVERKYAGRVPVSGLEPPPLTAYEQRRAARRAS